MIQVDLSKVLGPIKPVNGMETDRFAGAISTTPSIIVKRLFPLCAATI